MTGPRVTALEILRANVPLGAGRGGSGATEVDLFVVQLTCDDGATGTGFTYSLTGAGEGIYSLLTNTVSDGLLGTTLASWPAVSSTVLGRGERVGRGFLLAAISAIDIAVHDLRARAVELPLYEFLGAHRQIVPIYGSGRATHVMSADELVTGSQQYVAEGYRAVKLRIGARPPEEDIERIAAVRDALGSNIRIMVDANERLDLPTALWFVRRLSQLDIYWLEEPLRSDDIPGHAHLAEQGLPIAVGEHLHGRFEFANYVRAGAASILQPDAPLTGGVSEWMRISAIAEAGGAVLSPHFLPELHVHLAAAVPNCPYIEHFPLLDEVLDATLEISDGHATPPQRPGHGIQWNADALDRCRVA